MGTDPPSWVCWQNLPWQSVNLNYGCNANLRDPAPPIARPAVFPSYADRVAFGGEAPAAVPVPRFLQRNSAFPPPLDVMNVPSEAAAAERRFLIFDQSGDGTNLLFSSVGPPIWNLDQRSLKPKPFSKFGLEAMPGNYVPVNVSDGTDVSDGDGRDETHEDSDEIDALLYSDSEFDDADGEECEEFMGPSPEGMTASAEEVASNSVPMKRRRLNEEAIDMSLVDTASSELVPKPRIQCREDTGDQGDDSSCFGGPAGGVTDGQEQPLRAGAGKGLKRARIQETLCMLRKIIPGGKGKDDTAVLDEAIRYLRSLKLKAKVLGNKPK